MQSLGAADIRDLILHLTSDYLYELPGRGRDEELTLFPFAANMPNELARGATLTFRKVCTSLGKRIEKGHRDLSRRKDFRPASAASAEELRARLIP